MKEYLNKTGTAESAGHDAINFQAPRALCSMTTADCQQTWKNQRTLGISGSGER